MVGASQFRNNRVFDIVREIVDRFDFGFDITVEFVDVTAFLHFNGHAGEPFSRVRDDFPDVLDAVNSVLDSLTNRLFDLFGRRTGVRNSDANLSGRDIRKRFSPNRWVDDDSHDDQDSHHQIGCSWVFGKERNHQFDVPLTTSSNKVSASVSKLGSTNMPGMAGVASEMITVSCGSSPDSITVAWSW